MKRTWRCIVAFLWLTVASWIISFIVPLGLLFLALARTSGGISTSLAFTKFSFPPVQARLSRCWSAQTPVTKRGLFPTCLQRFTIHRSALSGRARFTSCLSRLYLPQFPFRSCRGCSAQGLTSRWSQPLTVAMRTFDFMKQFREFAALAPASDGSALSR
jgi:hypothetical protein